MAARRLQAEARVNQAGGRFEANESAVFGPMDLLVKRCKKLIELFTTIHQFSTLAQVFPMHIHTVKCTCALFTSQILATAWICRTPAESETIMLWLGVCESCRP